MIMYMWGDDYNVYLCIYVYVYCVWSDRSLYAVKSIARVHCIPISLPKKKMKEMKKKKIVQEVKEKEKVFPEFNNEKYEK